MNEIQTIHDAICALAKQNAQRVHREGHYTTVLCGMLWAELGPRILTWTGLGVKQLQAGIDSQTEKVRTDHIPETKDFYADLLLTDVPYQSRKNMDCCSLDRLVGETGVASITHVYEFKFLNAFKNMSRGHARKDTVKLHLLGVYLKNNNASGEKPHLEQVIFNFPAPGRRPKTNERLRSWFTDGGFREQFKDVAVTIVSPEGAMEPV